MIETHSNPPEEAREEILGLLKEVEEFPEIDVFSNLKDRIVKAPGIIIPVERSTFNSGGFIVVSPGGIFEAGMYSRVPMLGNGAVHQFPIRETQREIPLDRYPEFVGFIREKVKELKEKDSRENS